MALQRNEKLGEETSEILRLNSRKECQGEIEDVIKEHEVQWDR